VRITSVAQARAAYHDRNTSDATVWTQQVAIGPHGVVSRYTYTVPAGRKALVASAYARWRRVTVAAPVGKITLFLNQGVGSGMNADIHNLLNTVDAIESISGPGGLFMGPASGVVCNTGDLGTGGTCDYSATHFITEFDA